MSTRPHWTQCRSLLARRGMRTTRPLVHPTCSLSIRSSARITRRTLPQLQGQGLRAYRNAIGSETAERAIAPAREDDELGIVAELSRLRDQILLSQPSWRDRWELMRLVLAVVSVSHVRIPDFNIREQVGLLWVFESDRCIRSHSGVCCVYEDLSWKTFGGMISDVGLGRIQHNMQALEGVLRSLLSLANGAVGQERKLIAYFSEWCGTEYSPSDGFRDEGFLLEVHRCKQSLPPTNGRWPRAQLVPMLATSHARRSLGSFQGSRTLKLFSVNSRR